jgi:TetR/AcrR family transcriptional regulator, regulator of cefoperazone and chloramphenicol sensitivity
MLQSSVPPASPNLPDPSPADTQRRLLDAAGEEFAARGFRDATVRDICRRAGANVAAVNYHFGDKQGLYRAVFAELAREALAASPGATVDRGGSPADRLRVFVSVMVSRVLGEGRSHRHDQLMAREMIEPTGALDEVVEGFIRPQYVYLRGVVAELLGPAADEHRVRLHSASVVGQVLFYKHAQPVVGRLMPEQPYDGPGREQIARHIAEVSLAALAAARASFEGGVHP